jgi:hypothetical protein
MKGLKLIYLIANCHVPISIPGISETEPQATTVIFSHNSTCIFFAFTSFSFIFFHLQMGLGKTEWEDILIEKGIIAPPKESTIEHHPDVIYDINNTRNGEEEDDDDIDAMFEEEDEFIQQYKYQIIIIIVLFF